MTAQDITAPNPRLNASLDDGHTLAGKIQAASISANPRLYANQSGMNGCEVPENSSQDNSDLPTWATNFWDGSTTIQSILPGDTTTPVYLQVWVAERQNFYDVAQVLALLNAGLTLSQALV
jgi:hypothetical protein